MYTRLNQSVNSYRPNSFSRAASASHAFRVCRVFSLRDSRVVFASRIVNSFGNRETGHGVFYILPSRSYQLTLSLYFPKLTPFWFLCSIIITCLKSVFKKFWDFHLHALNLVTLTNKLGQH